MNEKTYDIIKRFLDIVLSLIFISLVLPLLIIVSFLIIVNLKGPIIHKTKRLGLNGKIFIKYKFRTMVPNGERALIELLQKNKKYKLEYESNFKIKDDPRITRIGKILRKYSIDELPQLFNVLIGNMSLVGPRDIIQNEFELHYKDVADVFLSVKPGLTGLWQISGRSKLSYQKRVELDMEYIRNRSIMMDIKIILKTPLIILKGDGE